MLIQTLKSAQIPELARFLIQQRQLEGLRDKRLWLTEGADWKLGNRLEQVPRDPEEQIWVALDESSGQIIGSLGAKAKSLGSEDIRRTYLPPHYGLFELATTAIEPGRWNEILPQLWNYARVWLRQHNVTQPQTWFNIANEEGEAAWLRLGFERLMDNAIRPLSEMDSYGADLPNDIQIRPASVRDLKRLVPLLMEELDYHAQLPGDYWVPLDQNTPRLARREVELFMTAGAGYIYLIAERLRDGQLLGYMNASTAPLLPENSNSLFHPRDRAILQVASVTAASRGQGVGTLLLSHLLAWFCQQHMTSVSLSYDVRNPVSGPFWRKQGFRPLRRALVITLP